VTSWGMDLLHLVLSESRNVGGGVIFPRRLVLGHGLERWHGGGYGHLGNHGGVVSFMGDSGAGEDMVDMPAMGVAAEGGQAGGY
jgi:hypothetical protein